VKEAIRENKTIKEIILKYGLIEETDLSKILSPEEMAV
jgi:aspartate ammonia-lyase